MDRGQIHTLEAFIGVLLLVGALLFASQATAVTPLSASTSNQHIENQQQRMAQDLLAITAANDSLRAGMTYWNVSGNATPHFAETDPNRSVYSTLDGTDHPLREPFTQALQSGVHAYNIDLRYLDGTGRFRTEPMVRMGTPSDNAVTATRSIILFENDTIRNPAGENATLVSLGSEEFWAPNVEADSQLYNVVEVRVTVWRM